VAITINRCVCAGRPFAEVVDRARRDRLSLPQVMDATGAGRGCGMCVPYLCRAWRTGQLTFHELIDPEDEPGPGAGPDGTDLHPATTGM
jgi:hypothetical protein